MNVLEKILEEISEVEKEYVTGHKVLYALGATGMATEISGIIRSHMDDVPKCGECSRKKLYQIGYEDGKKDKDWISVEDRLPEDDDMRFYMCIVENHEEDLPMFCQYDSEYGFGAGYYYAVHHAGYCINVGNIGYGYLDGKPAHGRNGIDIAGLGNKTVVLGKVPAHYSYTRFHAYALLMRCL